MHYVCRYVLSGCKLLDFYYLLYVLLNYSSMTQDYTRKFKYVFYCLNSYLMINFFMNNIKKERKAILSKSTHNREIMLFSTYFKNTYYRPVAILNTCKSQLKIPSYIRTLVTSAFYRRLFCVMKNKYILLLLFKLQKIIKLNHFLLV